MKRYEGWHGVPWLFWSVLAWLDLYFCIQHLMDHEWLRAASLVFAAGIAFYLADKAHWRYERLYGPWVKGVGRP